MAMTIEELYKKYQSGQGAGAKAPASTTTNQQEVESSAIEQLYKRWRQQDYEKNRAQYESSVQQRLADLNSRQSSFSDAYTSRYQNRNESTYYGDYDDWYQKVSQERDSYFADVDAFMEEFAKYEEFYDQDYVDSIRTSLYSGKQGYAQALTGAQADRDYFSQFKTEEDFQSYLAQMQEEEDKKNLNLDDAQKEIEALKEELNSLKVANTVPQNNYLTGNSSATSIPYAAGQQAQMKATPTDARITELERMISQKQAYLNQAKRTQEGYALSGVADPDSEHYDPEFISASRYKTTISEDHAWWQSGVGDNQYEWINNRNGFRDQYESEMADSGAQVAATSQTGINFGPSETEYKQKGYDHLTDDEIAIYNYYYTKDGKEKAQEYLDSIQETLNYRKATEMYEPMEDQTILELAFGVAAGLDQFSSGISNLLNFKDDYIPASATQMASGMVREDLGDVGPNLPKWLGGGSLGQMGYDTITTTANMAPSIMTSMAVGLLNPVAGQITGTALMGASAAGNAYQEMLNLGYDKGQARVYSALVGGSEAGLQYLLGGIGKLGGKVSGEVITKMMNGVDNAFLRTAIKLGGNMLSEGVEEGLQEILTPMFQNLVLHTDEDVDFAEVAYSTLLGALTAGFMEGGSTIKGEVDTYNTGRQLQEADISAQRLAEIGSTFSADTVAYQLAGRVDENTGAYTIGRLFNEIGATMTEQNVNEITEALVKKGVPRDIARENAKAMAIVVEGGNLTDRQVQVIEANEPLAEAVRTTIIDSNATWFQRTKGYNEALMALAQEKVSSDASRTNPASQSKESASAEGNLTTDAESGTQGISEALEVDTSPAAAKSFTSIKNGQATIKLEDDTEISAKDAELDPEDGVRIETIASIDGISVSDANYILNTLRATTGASAQMDALGAKEAYKYGLYGLSKEHMTKHGVFANSLTEAQRQAIYEAGQKARAQQVEATTPKKGTGTTKETGIYFDNGNGNVVAFKDAKKTVTDKQSAGVKAAMVLQKLGIGGDIYFFESYLNKKGQRVYKDKNGKEVNAPNGWYSKDGSIHIDLNAGNKGSGFVLFTLSHELTHFIEQWSPQKYKVLADFLVENYEKGQSMDKLVRAKQAKLSANRGTKVSYKEAYSEVVADSMEAMLADGNVMDKLLELKAKDNSLFMKMKQFFDNLVAKIRNVYKGQVPDSEEGRAVMEMTDAVEKIQQIFADALVEASENYATSSTTDLSGTVVYSDKIKSLTESDVYTLIENSNHGEYPVDSFIPVRRDTPPLLVVLSKIKEGLPPIKNLPIIMKVEHVQQCMDDDVAATDGKRGHALTADNIIDIIKGLDDPRYVFFQKDNKRYCEVIEYDAGIKGEKAFAIVTYTGNKNPDLMNGFPGGEYNILVTAYPPTSKTWKSYQKSENNMLIYDKTKGLPQGSYGSHVPSLLSGSPFATTVSQPDPEVKTESLTPGEEGTVFAENGDPVAHSTEDGTVQLSIRTYDEEGRDAFRSYLEKCVSSKKLTKAEMQEMLDGIEEIYSVCKEFKDKYAPFGTWSDAAVIRDTYGKPVFSVVTPNGDYKMNLDFSLVCKKRRTLDAVFNEMSRRGIIDDFELGQKSVVKINEIIRKHGFETACALCFVDAKRFRQASMADSFTRLYNELVLSLVPESKRSSIDHFNFAGYDTIKKVEGGIDTWNASDLDFSHLDEVMKNYGKGTVEYKAAKYIKTHADGRKLLLRGDFMSSQGFDAVKSQNKDILKLYNSKKGTGGPKAAFGDVQYMNEIIKKARHWTPAKAFAVGGVRIQSFSDYVPRMVFDYVQMIYDLAATGLPAHSYTKEALFAKQFGLTGVKINMSLIPAIADGGIAPGLDANGDYVWAGESFDFETAKQIQSAEGYTENCGTICVGVSDLHIRKLLNDPDIRMVIPYHKSGLNPIVAHMNRIAQFKDYTGSQNTLDQNGSKVSKDFDFDKALHAMGENGDPKAVINQYLEWCDERGYTPKFSQFRDHPNYYKLIEDFTLYDMNGQYVPQREVRAVFPKADSTFGAMKDLIKEGLEEDAVIEGKRDNRLSSIVDEIQKTLPKTEAEIPEAEVEQAERDLEAIELSDANTQFSFREEDPPKKVGVAYKVFLAKDGQLYPPMVANPNGEGTPVGVWLNADIGKAAPPSKTGRPQVQGGGKGTNSGKISLAFRPGWHLGDIPLAKQFAKLNPETGKKELFPANFVWAECEYAMDVDYQEEAMSYGYTENGKFRHSYAGLPKLPADGYYRYRTNPNPDTVPWVITGAMRVKRILTDAETDAICRANGVEPMARQGGEINLADFGLTAGDATEIKYSGRDSEGNSLTKEQSAFFAQSKVRDAEGNLLKVYHGSPNKFTTFRQGVADGWGKGIYFTDNRTEAETYGNNVVEAYLNITNPFNADTMSYDEIGAENTKAYRDFDRRQWKKRYDEYDTYEEYKADGLSADLYEIYTEEVEIFNQILRELGYDGIIANGSNGIDGMEIVAFNENQPKLTSNTNPTSAADIRYQDRSDDSVSNRSLLANALEGVAQNQIEAQAMAEYKRVIPLLDQEERKLQRLNEQIKELAFAKGPKDTKAIRDLQFEARQTANRINTFDRQLLRMEASKPLQAVLDREKKMAYKRAEQKGKEALAAYKEKALKTQREITERYQESRKKGIESRHKTAMRHKIKDVVNELNQYLLRGTKDRHVPIELQKAVAEALEAVNMDTVGAEERIAKLKDDLLKAKTPEQIQEISRKIDHIQEMGDRMNGRLKKLKEAYDQFVNSDDPLIANSHDEVISNKLQSVIESVGNTPLRDMTLTQLEDVYDMYRMVLTTIQNTNKAFKAKKSESISALGNRVMMEVEKVGGKKKLTIKGLDGVKGFAWNNLKPVYAFEHIGSETLTEIFDNVRAGEDVWAVDVTEAREYYLTESKKYRYDSWDFEKRYIFTSTSGMTFELSLEQIMSLYAYSKRDQAAEHLKKGGIVIDESTEITVKTKLGIPVKFNPTEATAYNISDETLADIVSKLSKEQKGFVDEMQDYLSTVMGAKGNEISLVMYGVKLFKEKFYFPLKSAQQFMAKAKEQAQGEAKIKNSGFSKETVQKASNPIVLTPFMNVWSNHVNEMSMYHAFVLPMEDFYRVYNYKTPTSETMATESVEMFIQNAYGKGATKYIDQLLKDLNGGARADHTTGIINKMMGLFKKGAVFASLSVVVQQPSAIARAAALVDTKYFIGPKVDHKRHKVLWDEVKQYAPVAIIKEMGYFDTNMGKSTQDFILGKEYSGFTEKMSALVKDSNYRDELLSKAPALADEIAWCSIWEAVKREVNDKYPKMDVKSEAFLKMVGERFTDVIVKTQVYDSVLSRSGLMRSKDTGMKMATAFMAEPTTSINMVADALLQGKRGNRKYARTAIGAVVASQILNSILVSFVYAGRDDDEDKTYLEKYIGTLSGEILDSLNPAGYIPFIKDIVSIVQGYDVERSDMAIISDLWNAWQNLSNDNVSAYRKVEGFAGSIAQIFGLPVKNIMRDARGIYQTIMSFVNGQQTTKAGIGYAMKSAVPEWLGGGDVSNQNQLYEAILSGDATQIARVKSRFKDQSAINSAIRKALRENDPRIKEAAVARYSGDLDEYMRIAREIIAEGHFSQDDVVAAINTEINDLDKGETTTSTQKASALFKAEDFAVAISQGDSAMANAIKVDIIQTAQKNGKTADEAEQSFKSSAKTEMKELFLAGEINEDQAISAMTTYLGIDLEDAEADVGEWAFEADYGFRYSDRGDAYKSGAISAAELQNILVTVGGKTEEEAALQVEVYNWQMEGFDIESNQISIIEDYETFCEPAGIDKNTYFNAYLFYGESGEEGVAYSKTIECMPYINSLPLTASQKTALAMCWWAESTVNKYKIW